MISMSVDKDDIVLSLNGSEFVMLKNKENRRLLNLITNGVHIGGVDLECLLHLISRASEKPNFTTLFDLEVSCIYLWKSYIALFEPSIYKSKCYIFTPNDDRILFWDFLDWAMDNIGKRYHILLLKGLSLSILDDVKTGKEKTHIIKQIKEFLKLFNTKKSKITIENNILKIDFGVDLPRLNNVEIDLSLIKSRSIESIEKMYDKQVDKLFKDYKTIPIS